MKLAMKMPTVKYRAWALHWGVIVGGSRVWSWAGKKPLSWAVAGNGNMTGAYARAGNKSWPSSRAGTSNR